MDTSTTPDIVKTILRRSEKDYTHWVPWYTFAVSTIGLFILLYSFFTLPPNNEGFSLFTIMAAVSQLFTVQLFKKSRARICSEEALIVASILIFGPCHSVLLSATTALCSHISDMLIHKETWKNRASWWQRVSFNIGMLVVATYFAGLVFTISGGINSNAFLSANLIPILFTGLTYQSVNLVTLFGVLKLQTGQQPLEIWKRDFQWNSAATVISSTIGGGLLALTYSTSMIASVSVLILITTLSYFYSRYYVSNMKKHVENLEEANTRLDNFNLNLFMTMSALIDAYDAYTFGHSAQVTVYSEAIAKKMGLKQNEIDVIVRGALVHDIGKVGVMDSIIGKQGRLTDEEYALVKKHPDIGVEILSRAKTEEMEEIIPLVRFHHERWDGSGYPLGLAGESIPLGARIISLADSVDAMLSDRPYRHPPSFEEVLEEVLRCMGTQFDPRVAQAFFEVAKEKGPNFFKNSAEAVDKKYRPEDLSFISPKTRYLKKSMIWALEGPGFYQQDGDD